MTIGAGSSAQRLAHNSDSITYRVRKGDSLSSIAKRHGVNIKDCLLYTSDNYPFNPRATQDASLDSFERFFKPDGILDNFYKNNLRLFLENDLTLSLIHI